MGHFGADRSSDFRGLGLAKRIKQALVPAGTVAVAESEAIQSDFGRSGDGDEYGVRLCTCHFQRVDRRRRLKGCEGCTNHSILMAKERKFCICIYVVRSDGSEKH